MEEEGGKSKWRENSKGGGKDGGADVGRIKHSRTNNILKARGRRAPPTPHLGAATTRQGMSDYYLGCLHTPPAARARTWKDRWAMEQGVWRREGDRRKE